MIWYLVKLMMVFFAKLIMWPGIPAFFMYAGIRYHGYLDLDTAVMCFFISALLASFYPPEAIWKKKTMFQQLDIETTVHKLKASRRSKLPIKTEEIIHELSINTVNHMKAHHDTKHLRSRINSARLQIALLYLLICNLQSELTFKEGQIDG